MSLTTKAVWIQFKLKWGTDNKSLLPGLVCRSGLLPRCFAVMFFGSLGFGRATQGQTETCPEAILALSWLYDSGHRLAGRGTALIDASPQFLGLHGFVIFLTCSLNCGTYRCVLL